MLDLEALVTGLATGRVPRNDEDNERCDDRDCLHKNKSVLGEKRCHGYPVIKRQSLDCDSDVVFLQDLLSAITRAHHRPGDDLDEASFEAFLSIGFESLR